MGGCKRDTMASGGRAVVAGVAGGGRRMSRWRVWRAAGWVHDFTGFVLPAGLVLFSWSERNALNRTAAPKPVRRFPRVGCMHGNRLRD